MSEYDEITGKDRFLQKGGMYDESIGDIITDEELRARQRAQEYLESLKFPTIRSHRVGKKAISDLEGVSRAQAVLRNRYTDKQRGAS